MNKLLLTLALFLTTAPAYASYLSGRFFGLVTQNGIDLDGNGVAGRSGYLPVVDSWAFAHAGANIDADFTDPMNPQGACGVGAFELTAYGQLTLTSKSGNNVLFAEIDSSTTICYDGVNPEIIILDIVGGRGWLDGAGGWIEVTLPADVVLNADAFGYPRVVYTDATFDVHLDW